MLFVCLLEGAMGAQEGCLCPCGVRTVLNAILVICYVQPMPAVCGSLTDLSCVCVWLMCRPSHCGSGTACPWLPTGKASLRQSSCCF